MQLLGEVWSMNDNRAHQYAPCDKEITWTGQGMQVARVGSWSEERYPTNFADFRSIRAQRRETLSVLAVGDCSPFPRPPFNPFNTGASAAYSPCALQHSRG
ncbi:hypothetical protein FKM82_016315 [Ascaphus truei]